MELPLPLSDYLKAVNLIQRPRPKLLIESELGPDLFARLVHYLGQFCPEFSVDYFQGDNAGEACQRLLGQLRSSFRRKVPEGSGVRAYFATSPETLRFLLEAGPSLGDWKRPCLPENPAFWATSGIPAFLSTSGGNNGPVALIDTDALDPEQSRILGFLKLIHLNYKVLE